MQLTVLIAPTKEHFRFQAKVGEPYALTVVAKDRETAFAAIAELMRVRAPQAELVRVDWPVYHPLFEACGSIDPNDPATQEFEEILRENRRREDEADGIYPELNEEPA
jgi:hypothetical protein